MQLPLYKKIGTDDMGRDVYEYELKDLNFFNGKRLRGAGWPDETWITVLDVNEIDQAFIAAKNIPGQDPEVSAYSFTCACWTLAD
jgi:hypothetical protein